MKGIIIYEDFITDFKSVVNCGRLSPACYTCRGSVNDLPEAGVSGGLLETTTAVCSKEDTYDFEVGALISLMKMCGFDKSYKAIEEAFRYNSYNNKKNNEYEKKIDALEKENSHLKYVISCRESAIESLENTRNLLIEKNNEVTTDREKTWKIYQNALQIIQEKQDRIIKLKEENKKLKLDCEKLQHGYIDTDTIFCGGRQNEKQYTFLVELFKKLPKEKVQAAYIVAYKESLIWLTSQPSIRDQLDSFIEGSKYAIPYADKWIKPPTKREEMWANIVGASQDPPVEIKVAKQDIRVFLKELQEHIPKARWNGSDCLPTEYTYPWWFKHDYIYFALYRIDETGYVRICYDENKHYWIGKPVIEYIPPMRWDLFKKGRLVVKVNTNNYEDFYNKCAVEIGRKPLDKYTGTFTVYYSKGTFHTRPYDEKIPYKHKVVNWEDVK